MSPARSSKPLFGLLIRSLMLVLTGASQLGCGSPAQSVDSAPKQLSVHQFATGAPVQKPLGEDCRTYGAAECASGLCIHHEQGTRSAWTCSQKCQGEQECPARWLCRTVLPSSPIKVCLPPSNWEAQATTVRELRLPPNVTVRPRPSSLVVFDGGLP